MNFKIARSFLAFCLVGVFAAVQSRPLLAAPVTKLASGKRALLPIVVSAGASEQVKATAKTLADYLGRMTGANFGVQTGDGQNGLALGLASDFPALPFGTTLDASDPKQREDYILRSHANGVYLIGATEKAVQPAIWDFLYRLGYRHFFPSPHWEIVPNTPELGVAVDTKEHPAYYARRIWFTYSTWPEQVERMSQWNLHNRATTGIVLNTGHSYGSIIGDNKAAFAAHPEYFASVGGKRQVGPQGKFDISNPGLRQLVIDWAIRKFEQNPELDSISVDPSDGGGWGDSEAEKKLGSISDRVTLLANEVADAVNKRFSAKYGQKYVGFYAYNYHSPPPTIRVHPNVVVSVATAFIKGGFTVDQLIDGWQKQGATIGMREYYSIIHWDHDLPNQARAARLSYMTRTIPHFHAKGARFMSAESSDNWGPNGLGYYVASRILWDLKEVDRVDEIVDDFLEKSFGPARKPMTEFYRLITDIKGAKPKPFTADFVGRMYRCLDTAYKSTNDAAIRARLDELAVYTRFLELYRTYRAARGEERQKAFETLLRYTYTTRDAQVIHSLAHYRTRERDKSVKTPVEYGWKSPEKDKKGNPVNLWKVNAPIGPAEIQNIVSEGVRNNKLLDFEPVGYSDDLVPATKLKLQAVDAGGAERMRGVQNYYTWAAKEGETFTLQVSAGHSYQNRGPAKVELFAVEEKAADEAVEEDANDEAPIVPPALASAEVPPDATEHAVQLKAGRLGLYRIQVSDRMMQTHVQWAPGMPMTMKSALDAPTAFTSRYTLYFYVPKGTKIVGALASGGGLVRDGAGKVAHTMGTASAYISLPVPPGQDGRLWRYEAAGGRLQLMTVPPFMARSGQELLLPKEVVEADALR